MRRLISPRFAWGIFALVVLTLVLLLPISARVSLMVVGNCWRVRCDWHWLPGSNRRLRYRWRGCLNVGSLKVLAELQKLRHSRWSTFLALGPWAPLIVALSAGSRRVVSVRVRIGTSDAAVTAALVGLAWMALGAALSWATHRSAPLSRPPEFHVQPVFQRSVLIVRARCIAKLRVRDAIIACLWLVSAKALVRFRRERIWRDTGIPSKA